MAKRTPNQSQADDGGRAAGAETARKPRLVTARPPRAEREAGAAVAGGQDQAGEMSDEFLGEGETPGEPVQAGSPDVRSSSMSSEPNEEDIRLRAYHRYVERGGGHGQDYEDWLEAERELKGAKQPR
jgi:hypothetical protein